MELSKERLERLRELLAPAHQQIVIVSHTNPDGDAVGSSLAWAEALRSMGHEVTCVVPNKYPYFLDWMQGIEEVVVFKNDTEGRAARAIADLRAAGVKKTVMLTGDRTPVARAVAAELGIDEVHAELLPQDKVAEVEALLAQTERDTNGKGKFAFVGDGINDAPVLTRADIGIAMGAMGSDAAIEAADIVLMNDDPDDIARAIHLARRTMGVVWQNIVFALGVKFAVLVLAAFGIANMWMAVFADVGVAVIAILNAMRAMNVKRYLD